MTIPNDVIVISAIYFASLLSRKDHGVYGIREKKYDRIVENLTNRCFDILDFLFLNYMGKTNCLSQRAIELISFFPTSVPFSYIKPTPWFRP